jgi:N-acetylglutamate synthase-like GNAT family acetyltransferase
MDYKDFVVAEDKDRIVGFGRLWEHDNAVELGTIGVEEKYRGKGIAKMIVNHFLCNIKTDVYLTTLIPSFFEQFGFKRLDTSPPDSMIRKKEWCEGCTKVGCTVMKRKPA